MRSISGSHSKYLLVSKEYLSASDVLHLMVADTSSIRGPQKCFEIQVTQIAVQKKCPRWLGFAPRDRGYPLSHGYCFDKRLYKFHERDTRIQNSSIRVIQDRIVLTASRRSLRFEKYHTRGVFATRLLISVSDIIHFTMFPDRALPRDLFGKPFSPQAWLIIASYKGVVIFLLWCGGVRDMRHHVLKIFCSSITAVKMPRVGRFVLGMIVGLIMLMSTVPTTFYRTALTSIVNKPPIEIRSEDDLAKSDRVVQLAGYNMSVQYKNAFHAQVRFVWLSFADVTRVINNLQRSKVVAVPNLTLRVLEATHLAHQKIHRLKRSNLSPLVEYIAVRPNTQNDIKYLRPWTMRIFENRLYRFRLNSITKSGKRVEFAVKGDDPISLTMGLFKPLYFCYGCFNSVSIFNFLLTLFLNRWRSKVEQRKIFQKRVLLRKVKKAENIQCYERPWHILHNKPHGGVS